MEVEEGGVHFRGIVYSSLETDGKAELSSSIRGQMYNMDRIS